LGQQGWRALDEQEEIAAILSGGADRMTLDVVCGSGGPSLSLVHRAGCHLIDVDAEEETIVWARATLELGEI
jgi:hypothetical protein